MPNTTAPLTFDDPDLETALFRHGLIAHLIHHASRPDSGRLEAELRQLAEQTYVIPYSKRTRVSLASLRRYYRAYRAHGFEALLPKGRRDAGLPQAFDPAVVQRAIALREQQPERTTPMVVEILKREGHTVNAHTLTTHLRQAGKTRKLLGGQPAPTRRFERDTCTTVRCVSRQFFVAERHQSGPLTARPHPAGPRFAAADAPDCVSG